MDWSALSKNPNAILQIFNKNLRQKKLRKVKLRKYN